MNLTRIFTDGAARDNPGRGGWGAIVASKDKVLELGGAEGHTTNNRMELTAAIRALALVLTISPSDPVSLYTDSAYVLNGATKWLSSWQKNDWRGSAKKPVLNRDLWQELSIILDEFKTRKVSLAWNLLPGHSGIPANERCDAIATGFADGKKINLFEGAKSGYSIDLTVSARPTSRPKNSDKKKRSRLAAYSYVSCVAGKVETHATWAECEKRVKGVSGAKFKKALDSEDERRIKAEWA